MACIEVAARHTAASRCLFKIGRRASSTASHAGACGTIISTIVRRSASHAVLDAPRPVFSSTSAPRPPGVS
nr:DUF1534 domain-containing protein [Pseudomonas syringae pv. theae]